MNFAQQLKAAETFLRDCPYLGETVRKQGACTIAPHQRDPFDTLIVSIISQQLSVKAADTIEARVRKLGGDPFSPEKLLNCQIDELRMAGLSGRKVEYVRGIAKAVIEDGLDLRAMRELPAETVMQQLTSLRGVGQWTAEMFMIFSLGHLDIFSVLDVGLQRGMQQLFGDRADSPSAMQKLATRWSPYRSVASWYLWRLVD